MTRDGDGCGREGCACENEQAVAALVATGVLRWTITRGGRMLAVPTVDYST